VHGSTRAWARTSPAAPRRLAIHRQRGALSTLIAALALRYFYVSEQWRARVRAASKAEVDALQARIRPHFLFNSMNTIASLVRTDPATAERAVEDLSELFRAALGAGEGESTLARRSDSRALPGDRGLAPGPRLRVAWSRAGRAEDLRMPRLVLQPLLENAVLHGIARCRRAAQVASTSRARRPRLRIEVRNPASAAA
jgi:two-component system sensor histidine kinase AlgZ